MKKHISPQRMKKYVLRTTVSDLQHFKNQMYLKVSDDIFNWK